MPEPIDEDVPGPAPVLTPDGPMLHLPEIQTQELKMIGRRISFHAKCADSSENQSVAVFEGDVIFITRDTVVLMRLQKFDLDSHGALKTLRTLGDEVIYQEDERDGGGATSSQTASNNDHATMVTVVSGHEEEDNDTDEEDDGATSSRSTSSLLRPARRPKRPDALDFVTFSRKSISNVEFPPEFKLSEHEFLQDSAFLFEDEQRLRMLTRRFLVHNCMNNNPRNITLLHFVSNKCPWPEADVDYVVKVAEEELDALREVDKVAHAAVAARTARANAERNIVIPNADGTATTIRVPGGRHALANVPYGEQGILYLTGIPTRSSYLAVGHLLLSITLLLYSASAFSTVEEYIMPDIVERMSTFAALSAAIHLFLGGVTGFHALKMKVPINTRPLIARVAVLCASTGMLIYVAFVMGSALFQDRAVLRGRSVEEIYVENAYSRPIEICNFVTKHKCSGYATTCFELNGFAFDGVPIAEELVFCPAVCLSMQRSMSQPCKPIIGDMIHDTVMPIFVIAMIALTLCLIDWLLIVQMILFVKKLGITA